MKLFSPDASSFELKIVGYQFPELDNEEYDSNWLIIAINVIHPKGQWGATDPCLLTYEVAKLADWFESIANGEQVKPKLSFIEPNLEFRLIDSELKFIRVYFEVEFRPNWASWDKGLMRDLWVEFPIQSLNLNNASRSLRKQLAKYPQRTAR